MWLRSTHGHANLKYEAVRECAASLELGRDMKKRQEVKSMFGKVLFTNSPGVGALERVSGSKPFLKISLGMHMTSRSDEKAE